ncbi:hypothetical protein ACFSUK_15920 [Sphingobium scionense]
MRTVINRRGFIAAGVSLMIGSAARSALPVIRQAPKARIIIDNDFAGDPDGLIALAHQLATKAARYGAGHDIGARREAGGAGRTA